METNNHFVYEKNIQFGDIFNIEEIQQLQDIFAESHGVASIITNTDGSPITRPSNFCRLCNDIIRKTKKGKLNCFKSDSIIGNFNPEKPVVQTCLSGGLWDAGASITVGGKHIANWLIGQVKNESVDKQRMLKYADDIGANREEFMSALDEVTEMSLDKFKKIANMLFIFANELSEKAFNNLQLKTEIAERERLFERLQESEERLSLSILATNDGLWDLNLKLQKWYFSPHCYHMLGYQTNEFISDFENWKGLLHPDDKEYWINSLNECIDLGKDFNIEYRLLTKIGEWKWILGRGKIVERDDLGKPVRMVGTHVDISDRKLAEENLRKSEERNRLLSEVTLEGILIHKDTIVIDFNISLAQMLGYQREELLQRSILDHISKKDHEVILQNIEKDYVKPYEVRMIRKSGEIFFAELEARSFYSQKEKLRVVSFRDISNRKKTEVLLKEKNEEIEAQNEEYSQINEELYQTNQELLIAKYIAEENEEKFRQLAENVDEVFWLRNDSEMLYVNPAFEKVWGIPCQKLYDNPRIFTELVHPDDKQTLERIFQSDTFKKDGLFNYDYRIIRGDKQVRWINAKSMPVCDYSGKVVRRVGVARDITDKIENERELVKAKNKAEVNEKRLQSIFLVAPTGIGVTKNRIITDVNPMLCQMTGYEKKEMLNKSARILYPSVEEYEISGKEKYRQIHKKGTGTVETKWKKKDGTIIDILLSSTPIDPTDLDAGITFTALDISDRKRAEYELVHEKERAEESDRLKTAFLQNMSHEIRTPMNAIMGFSALLPQTYNNQQKLLQYSGIINTRCNDLLEIINDILDIAKIESGQVSVNKEKVSLEELFLELSLTFEEIQKKNCKQQIQFGLTLPPGQNHTLFTDKIKLKQILINLISNAFKFTQKGKIEGGCKLNASNNLVFYVSDTGIGIPVDKHKTIFERFAQLHQGSNKYGGTGLGLSIVKGLVKLLEGEIWLESEPGIGSTFYFSLPTGLSSPPQEPLSETLSI